MKPEGLAESLNRLLAASTGLHDHKLCQNEESYHDYAQNSSRFITHGCSRLSLVPEMKEGKITTVTLCYFL